MIEIDKFPFYINYMDIELYLFWIIEHFNYDEYSTFATLIDEKFDERITNPKEDADELLFEIRSFLAKNGFLKEVQMCDREFADTRKNRKKVNPYISLNKRLN